MEIPSQIDGHYRVLETLGSGLSGEILKVQGPSGIAALKLLRREIEGLADEQRIATFKFEFSLLKGLAHPNIVRIFDFGFDEILQRFYFTQELVEGKTIHQFPKLTVDQIHQLFVQALQGLAYLHGHDVLHGDLKPDNLLVSLSQSNSPQLKIIDFGISHPSLVQTGGTPPFMAPEKILNEPTDARSDLYSLAVVFYSLLTGDNPFHRKNIFATLRAHLHFVPPSATMLRKEVDPVWSELLSLMLTKNPRNRISSAEACLRFLETRGETRIVMERPKSLPSTFVGREEILHEAEAFLDRLKKKDSPQVLLVLAEQGLGATQLLTDMKYEAELREIEVVSGPEAPRRAKAISFLGETEALQLKENGDLKKRLERISLAISIPPEWENSFRSELGGSLVQALRLRPLRREEVEKYLQEITRNPKIPATLLDSLMQWSRGYPEPLREALQGLLQDPLIVDNSGKWQLAVFQEASPSLPPFHFSGETFSHAVAGETGGNLQERWRLELLRAEKLARQGKLDEGLGVLTQLEGTLAEVFDRSQRLLERARLAETRGWIHTKRGRYQEAREDFASGLSLLKEAETPSVPLELRLRNLVAFLDLQEGRLHEAISQFESSADRAKTLHPAEQRLVTNNELASAYLSAGRVGEGIAQLERDLEFFSSHADPFFQMKIGYNLGEAYTKNKKYLEAAEAYLRVAEVARRERYWEYLTRAYNGLGNVSNLQQRREDSLDYYQRSLALAEYLRDYLSAATVAQNRGVLLSESGRLDEAVHDLELSKRLVGKIHPSSHTRYLMARATLELGEVARQKGELQTARTYFTEALNRSEEDPNLKSFRFYPYAALATLAKDEKDDETLRQLAPKLIYLAQTEEEKKTVSELFTQGTVDPTKGFEKTSKEIISTAAPQNALANILSINRALLTERDSKLLFQKILQYAAELCGAETALLLINEERGGLAVREAFNTELDRGQKEISQQIARKVLQTGIAVVTPDAQVDPGFNQFQSVIALQLRSIACVPIRAQQKVVGLLYLAHRYKKGLFHHETLKLLETFGDQAGLALQNLQYLERLQNSNLQLQAQLEEADAEIDQLKTDLKGKVRNPYPKIVGKSCVIVETLHLLDRISDTNWNLLILGETGTGKELIARSVHEHSKRRKGPFVAVHCGAIPEHLMESELFGYKAETFTGTTRDKRGLLEEANGGTLFLDEISALSLHTQAKLLRALQERKIVRIGDSDTKALNLDLRLVTATHRHLEEEDLFYRAAQMILNLPALRERREDLHLLADHFLERSARELHMAKPPRLHRDLLRLMMAYAWPGNVRELENFIRTASAFADRGQIRLESIPDFLRKRLQSPPLAAVRAADPPRQATPATTATSAKSGGLFQNGWTWARYEEALYASSLLEHGMDCTQVARSLGVGIATVYVKMRKYGLKSKRREWEDAAPLFPPGITAAELKNKIVLESYLRNQESPYAVARELGINVGTVYRQLESLPKNSNGQSARVFSFSQ